MSTISMLCQRSVAQSSSCFAWVAAAIITLTVSVPATATINIQGSDSVEPILKEALTDYKRAKPDAAITFDAKGTGSGMTAFCKGAADIGMASRRINNNEFGLCGANAVEYYQIPIGWDAIAVMSHSGNSWLQSLTVDELVLIFEAASTTKVIQWNQVRASFPASKMVLVGLDMRSGTADFFSTALKGFPKLLRTDMRLEADHARVARLVASTPNAIGFASLTGLTGVNVNVVAIDEGKGQGAIAPSVATILDGKYDKLSRLLYLYVSKSAYSTKPDVKDFVDFTLNTMAKYVKDAGALPLTNANYETAKVRIKEGRTGAAQ
jgi:phosphate transport system substrate-binding protein